MTQLTQPPRLIMMEGLPSTGKSTNAGILLRQLERSGKPARWIHEVARPHPVLFFYEAYMDNEEYAAFLARYPHAAPVLEHALDRRRHGVGIDLLEAEWNGCEQLGAEAYEALRSCDVWSFSLQRYRQTALEKWECFVERQLRTDETVILDSAIFQFQIYTFLLADVPYAELQRFIDELYAILAPLNPSLIYLYREDTENTIRHLVQARGTEFMARIWERDRHNPYYKNRPSGAEGYRMFLRDYGDYAKRLFDSAPVRKRAIEITAGDWESYAGMMCGFAGVSRMPDHDVPPPGGTYVNEELSMQVQLTGRELMTPDGARKQLLHKSDKSFYIHDLPVIVRIDGERLFIEGEQLCDRWTAAGTVFRKQRN